MGDFTTGFSASTVVPSEAVRQERRLAEQLREAQTSRSGAERALLERNANERLLAERADRQFAQRRADDREDVARILADETRRRDAVALEDQRRIIRAEADVQIQLARQIGDEQRLIQQLREVEARQIERREEERQRIVRQQIDQRLSEQRLDETRFRDGTGRAIDQGAGAQNPPVAPRGSIVDITG